MVKVVEYIWENRDGVNTMLDIAGKGICVATYLKNLIKNKIQEKIYKDINKEIKKSKDKLELLDEDILDELFIILENSIKNEDFLARHYIEIISELSSIEFLIFKNVKQIEIKTTKHVSNPISDGYMAVSERFNNQYYFNQMKTIDNPTIKKIPNELIKKSIKKLIDLELISENKKDISKNNDLYTELGRNLYNASIKNIEK